MKPTKPHRVFTLPLLGHPFGDKTECPTIFAPTESQAREAAEFYQRQIVATNDTLARINRAIARHANFDAEARHVLTCRNRPPGRYGGLAFSH